MNLWIIFITVLWSTIIMCIMNSFPPPPPPYFNQKITEILKYVNFFDFFGRKTVKFSKKEKNAFKKV